MLDAWPLVHEPDALDEESKGLTRQHRRIDQASVSAELTTAVVGVYTVPIRRSDHKGVVMQLLPEEEAGVSRRTIPVEIIKTKEFQLEMQKELDRMSGLQGDAWWARMEEVAHSISAEVKAGQKDWTNSMWQLEEALSASSIRRLTGAAKKVLAEEGVPYNNTKEAYQRLSKVVSKRRKGKRRQQLLDRVKEAMKEEAQEEEGETVGEPQKEDKRKKRGLQVNRLLQQIIQRKQTAVVQLGDGRKVSGVQQVGKELGKYWDGIMQSLEVTVQECEAFIHGLEPPRTWMEALPQLWKKPSEEMVITALEGLDPSSAPGEDGIPATMYPVFADIFVPRILLKMDHLAKVGKRGGTWARGIMRTIPKEAGNLAVDKQRPITLLNSKAKWICACRTA